MDKIFGWTIEQWALALNSNKAELNTLKDFLIVRREYLYRHRGINPIEVMTLINKEGDVRERDWDTAFKLQDLVTSHMFGRRDPKYVWKDRREKMHGRRKHRKNLSLAG